MDLAVKTNGHRNGAGGYPSAELTLFDDLDLTALDRSGAAPPEAGVECLIRSLLTELGEDAQREGLLNTPRRVHRMYDELLAGYTMDPAAVINNALFSAGSDELVVVRDVELFSLCEHHLLPFVGRAHVAYLPGERVIGLSKIPRIVEMFARRLQIQERLTDQVADFVEEVLKPRGTAVVIEAAHLCARMRGVKTASASLVTSAMRGEFQTNPDLRREFMGHLSRPALPDLL